MRLHLLLLTLLFLWLPLSVTTAVTAQTPDAHRPHLTADDRIVSGTKGIWHKRRLHGQLILSIDNDAIGTMFDMFKFGESEVSAVVFANKKIEVVGDRSIFTGDVRTSTAHAHKLGTYQLALTLLTSGLIKVESTLQLDDPTLLKNRYLLLDLPKYLRLSGERVQNGVGTAFDDSKPVEFAADELKGATFNVFPDNSDRSFSITPLDCSKIRIDGSRLSLQAGDEGGLSFLLDIGGQQVSEAAEELSPNGINFWEMDRLHLPDYGASRNLLMNPSFEAGLRYWAFPTYAGGAMPLRFTNIYELDDAQARSGEHSLRIRALPLRTTLSLGTFALPFIVGEQYTLSFYVKGTDDQPVTLNVWGRGPKPQLLPGNVVSVPVTREWTRHTIAFVPTDRFGSVYFDAKTSGEREDQLVWLDDVQVERGAATDAVQPPVAAQLLSADRGNFLRYGQDPEFRLIVKSRPNARGAVALTVDDFFFKRVYEAELSFDTDASGEVSLVLDELNQWLTREHARGVFSVSATFTMEGVDEPFRDDFRFSVMDCLDNTAKNKNIFNLTYAYSPQAAGPEMERFVAREQAIGFGSIAYDFISFANDLDHDLDRERAELVGRYGFDLMGRAVLKQHDGVGGEISEHGGKLKMQGIKSRIDPTVEELAEFESIVAAKAASRPWNQIWWFTGESNPGAMPLESHPEAFARFLLATLRGAKRGNPDAKVLIEGGPWTLEPELGGKWVERYLQDTRRLDPKARFDGAAAHHYRNFPENPDTDADIASFLAMLDRNGYSDWPLYLNEGGNFAPFNIAPEGMSPYVVQSANAWYFGPLSYHFGRAERISAAFSARMWIIGLKYAHRVACIQDFNTPNRYVDIDFTPRPYDKIPNTIHRLLGNATFYKDIRFAPEVRCYVFTDDGSGAPIAAVWGHKESVDRWKEEAPLYTFDLRGQDVTVIDVMENEVDVPTNAEGLSILPMSPFPLFIRGEPESEEALCEAIAGAVASDAQSPALGITAIPVGPGEASVIFRNPIGKAFNGEAQVSVNDTSRLTALDIPPLDQVELTVPVPQASADYGTLLPFNFICTVGGEVARSLASDYIPIKYESSDTVSWDGPAIELRPGTSMKIRVAGDRLWVSLTTRDPRESAAELFSGVGIYIDPFQRIADWDRPRTAQQDMAVFELQPAAQGGLEAMCHYVQGTQAGSGTKTLVRGSVQKAIVVNTVDSEKSASVAFSIPQEVLAPVILKPGGRLGINLSLPSTSGPVATLTTIDQHEDASRPGVMDMVLVLFCE